MSIDIISLDIYYRLNLHYFVFENMLSTLNARDILEDTHNSQYGYIVLLYYVKKSF